MRFAAGSGGGKATALNTGVALARHDVIVFADARQRFAPRRRPGAGRELRRSVGRRRLRRARARLRGRHERVGRGRRVGAYWRYEKWIRARESAVASMLGATGAIYAIRRDAWRALPAGTILDDVLAPMRAVLAGWRAVFEPGARAFDVTASDTSAEQRRKTRTLAGNWQILAREPRLLLPWTNPVWLQYLSHKVGRLLVPFALVAGSHVGAGPGGVVVGSRSPPSSCSWCSMRLRRTGRGSTGATRARRTAPDKAPEDGGECVGSSTVARGWRGRSCR